MSRYREFVLKHIDKIDRNDPDQLREFLLLVRSSAERQIREHYSDAADHATELAALDEAIDAVRQESSSQPTGPKVAVPETTTLTPTTVASKRRSWRNKALVVFGLALAALGYFYNPFAACPAISCSDSGWVRARNNEANTLTIPHQLGVLPRHISIWYSRTGTEEMAQPLLWSWSETTTGNPVDIQVMPTHTNLMIVPDRPLHGLYSTSQGFLTHETGFFRVIVRK